MCGLVGIVGNGLTASHLVAFKWLLHLDVIRGEHSTGVAYRTKLGQANTITTMKATGHPNKLQAAYPDMFKENGELIITRPHDVSFLMGHNRSATIGEKTTKNAHPFRQGHIIGCHNGTIQTGLPQLPTSEAILGNTDSERLFYAISQDWSLQEIFDKVRGAAALTWWNSRDQTFNLYRNSERPLYVAESKQGSSLVYASEAWMIKAALAKAKLVASYEEPKSYPVDVHTVLSVGSFKLKEESSTVIKKTQVAAPVKTRWMDNDEGIPNWVRNGKQKDTTFRPASGWLDRSHLTKEEFDRDTKLGCALCSTDLDWQEQEANEVYWLDKDTPLCALCAGEFQEEEEKEETV